MWQSSHLPTLPVEMVFLIALLLLGFLGARRQMSLLHFISRAFSSVSAQDTSTEAWSYMEGNTNIECFVIHLLAPMSLVLSHSDGCGWHTVPDSPLEARATHHSGSVSKVPPRCWLRGHIPCLETSHHPPVQLQEWPHFPLDGPSAWPWQAFLVFLELFLRPAICLTLRAFESAIHQLTSGSGAHLWVIVVVQHHGKTFDTEVLWHNVLPQQNALS